MCTAAGYKTRDFYFGRTLDYEFSYGEQVVITPRNFTFELRHSQKLESHYAIIGMAHIADGYPLYYDAANEKGLAMAGLNFVGNAVYRKAAASKDNIAQFEFIPWILGKCASVKEAAALLENINLTNTSFSENLPLAELHWMIADKDEAIVVESVKDGLKIYQNPVGVLTNNPPFNEQLSRLNDYMAISTKSPQNNFSPVLELSAYSRGMGALGLPGDLSSQSRFVRAAFVKMNSVSGDDENESVSQFFHILGSVEQQRGCCEVSKGKYEITIYTSCMNTDKGIYYYTTYGNRQITAVDMKKKDLDGEELIKYPLILAEQINFQN
ncbi:MAG: choloylglycine hydrolase [Oscillospiraceae bacterium]|nr:choloylglycine hydrolase [Oscillospiraceae bacterium]